MPLSLDEVFGLLVRNVREQARIAGALKVRRDRLTAKSHFVGYGVGKKTRGGKTQSGLSAILFVDRKVPLQKLKKKDRLPSWIKVGTRRVPTDVVKIGKPNFLASQLRYTTKERPVKMGASIGTCEVTRAANGRDRADPNATWAGTAGWSVVDTLGQHYIMSAAHVLKEQFYDIVQPTKGQNRDDPSTLAVGQVPNPHDNIGAVVKLAGGGVDAGIFEVNSEPSIDIVELGTPTGILPPMLQLPVQKSGASSGVSRGIVINPHFAYYLPKNPDPAVFRYYPGPSPTARWLEGAFRIIPMDSEPGDSGAPIVAGPEPDLVNFVQNLNPNISDDMAKSVANLLLNNAVGMAIMNAPSGAETVGVDIDTATSSLSVKLDGIMPSNLGHNLIRAFRKR